MNSAALEQKLVLLLRGKFGKVAQRLMAVSSEVSVDRLRNALQYNGALENTAALPSACTSCLVLGINPPRLY